MVVRAKIAPILLAILVGNLSGGSAAAQTAPSYTATEIGDLPDGTPCSPSPCAGSYATAVNDYSQVVGESPIDAPGQSCHAFIWEDGSMMDLGTLPGGTRSEARAINSNTQVVGGASTSGDALSHAFLWDGDMHDLGTLGGDGTASETVSRRGDDTLS